MQFIGYQRVKFQEMSGENAIFTNIDTNDPVSIPLEQIKGQLPTPVSNQTILLEGDDNYYYLIYSMP